MPIPVKKITQQIPKTMLKALPETNSLTAPTKNQEADEINEPRESIATQEDDFMIVGLDDPRQPRIPEGVYEAIVENVRNAGTKISKRGFEVPMVSMDFKTGQGVTISYKIPRLIREGYPLYQMLENMCGYKGGEFNLKTLVNRDCVIRVVHREMENGDIWENVSEVLKTANPSGGVARPQPRQRPTTSPVSETNDLFK